MTNTTIKKVAPLAREPDGKSLRQPISKDYGLSRSDFEPLVTPLLNKHLINNNGANVTDYSNENFNDIGFFWPWSNNRTTVNSRCNSFENCNSCTKSSFACHWCSYDNMCHAKGSWYGCAIGASCSDGSNATQGCKSHSDCTTCSLSSSLCHWCAFDEQCHAVGSIYGCSQGVNCYSNERCRRMRPENISEGIFDDVGVIPIIFIIFSTIITICFSSLIYGAANALKLALDGIVDTRDRVYEPNHNEDFLPHSASTETVGEEENRNETTQEHNPMNDESIHVEQESDDNHEVSQRRALDAMNSVSSNNSPSSEENSEELTQNLLEVTHHLDPLRVPPQRRYSQAQVSMHCLLRSCRFWYFATLFITLLLSISSIIFFPRAPQFNVCSNEFAWKSIVDAITSLKLEASFEILVSVENKNKLDISVENLEGKFRYDGEDVGTFTMKRVIIQATTITDAVITCTVVPSKWDALGIISDYYKSKLTFMADLAGMVKIRGIALSIPMRVTNFLVKVNDPEMKDRHLCACPEWKDLAPTSSPVDQLRGGFSMRSEIASSF